MGRVTRRFVTGGLAALPAFVASTSLRASDEAVDTIWREIGDLARQADRLDLKTSSLSRGNPVSRPEASNLYYESLPRLVALQARGQSESSGADVERRAGALLSQINLFERSPAEMFARKRGAPPPSFNSIKNEYRSLYDGMIVRQTDRRQVTWYLSVLTTYQHTYEAVAKITKIPWYFIGILHALEASFNFHGHLHNGDPLDAVTVHVPAGRPDPWLPPSDWQSSAVDALTIEGFVGETDWGLERMLYRFESYNGFGYRRHHIHTPYLWSFSNNYVAGKFKADGKWSPTAKSQQCGAALMIKGLERIGAIGGI